MATTYQSDRVLYSSPRAGIHESLVIETYEAATALVINDVIEMIPVPAGATVAEMFLATDDLDTGTTIVLAVGDGDDDDRYIAGSTIGQAGGNASIGAGITAASVACIHTYSAADTIDVKVTTAPTGGGTGTIVLAVRYTMNP